MAERKVTYIVGANIRNFQKGMKDVSSRFRRMQRELHAVGSKMTRMVTGPITALAAGMIGLQVKTGQYADELLDLSEITGLSTDSLQEWRNVARIAGVESDALSNAASGLSRRMRGIDEESGAAFKAAEKLGISFKDAGGNLRDTDEIMTDAISRLSQMEPGLERAALAGDLFGRRWEQIAPILGMTSKEIDGARRQAHELGLVMDGPALNAANEFRQEWELLRERFAASARTLATGFMPLVRNEFIPMVERAFDNVQKLTSRFTSLDMASQKQIVTFGLLAAAIGPAILIMSKLAGVIAALASPLAIKIALLAGLALAFTYVIKNADAFAEHMKFIMNRSLKYVTDGITGIIGWLAELAAKTGQRHLALGLWQMTAAAEEFAGSIDLSEPTTKFQDFGEFYNEVKDDVIRGLNELTDRIFRFSREVAELDFGPGISGREMGIGLTITPPDIRPVEEAERSLKEIIGRMTSRWEDFWTTFQEIGGDFKAFLANEMSAAVLSFGNALGRSLAGADNQWQTTFERITMVVLEFAKSLARLAAGIGAVMMFIPGYQGAGAGLMAAAAALTAVTTGVQAGIEKRASNRQARSVSVDDGLIRSDGSVVHLNPNDNILAMKDFTKLGASNDFARPASRVPVVLRMNDREVARAMVDLDHWRGRG